MIVPLFIETQKELSVVIQVVEMWYKIVISHIKRGKYKSIGDFYIKNAEGRQDVWSIKFHLQYTQFKVWPHFSVDESTLREKSLIDSAD